MKAEPRDLILDWADDIDPVQTAVDFDYATGVCVSVRLSQLRRRARRHPNLAALAQKWGITLDIMRAFVAPQSFDRWKREKEIRDRVGRMVSAVLDKGLRPCHVAEMFGVTENNVNSQVSKARARRRAAGRP